MLTSSHQRKQLSLSPLLGECAGGREKSSATRECFSRMLSSCVSSVWFSLRTCRISSHHIVCALTAAISGLIRCPARKGELLCCKQFQTVIHDLDSRHKDHRAAGISAS